MAAQQRLEALFRDHGAAVRVYAARRVGLHDADEIVSEVFLVAWRRRDDVPANARPWLLGVARRIIANQRRGEMRRVALHDRLNRGVEVNHSAAEPALSDGHVAAALAALSDRDREVLLLTAWDGLGHAEAARVLGVRTATVTVRLHRARRRFAHLLSALEDGPARSIPMEAL